MKVRTVTEYRVVSTRRVIDPEGREYDQRTEKRYASLLRVRDRIGILTSDEPWRFFGSKEDRQRDGDESEGGLTLRQETAERRKDLPPIVSVTVQKRTVTRTTWEPCEAGEVE